MIALHPDTKDNLNDLAKAQAIVIHGPSGSGKLVLSRLVAEHALGVGTLTNYPFHVEIDAIDGIESVRGVKAFLAKKTTGRGRVRRSIIIKNADLLSHSAQNALLKTLEEPPEDSLIILTATDKIKLLPTILSRVQQAFARPLSLSYVLAHAGEYGISQDDARRYFYMSNGQSVLFQQLATDDQHPLKQQTDYAKEVLAMNRFERLSLVDKLYKDKESCSNLVNGLIVVITAAMRTAIAKGDRLRSKQLRSILSAVLLAQERLSKNVQPKLVLTELFLSI